MNNYTNMEFDKLCNTILEINNNIHSVSVISKHGRAMERKVQGNTDLQVIDQKNEMFFMQCALTISMGKDFDEDFGEIGYIHIDRKNLSMFSFPLFDNIVLVTSKAAMSPISLARKITTIIKKYTTPHAITHVSEKNMWQQEMPKEIIQLSHV